MLLTLTRLIVLCAGLVYVSGQPIVDTIYGRLQGKTEFDRLNRTYDAFRGVPFAAPPIGDLRWELPQTPAAWEGVRLAEEYGAHCIHQVASFYGFVGYSPDESEDCLYMNIFVPGGVNNTGASPLPVMMFYFGGVYILGTAEMYPAQELATNGQVISVTFNYRLGVFGFLTTADSVAPGNYGLWDTKGAIDWVRATISAFGGDPERITVFGQSAGAISVQHNILSPVMNSLIHGGISMSGGDYCIVASKSMAQGLADHIGCNTTDSQQIVDCLRQVDGKELDKTVNRNRFRFASPVIDGTFITQDPGISWQEGIGKDTHYMVGFCHMDIAGFIIGNPLGIPTDRTQELTTEQVQAMLLNIHKNDDDPHHTVMTLYERYPALADPDPAVCTEALARFLTDQSVGASTYQNMNYRAETDGRGNTYHYIFQHSFSFQTGYPAWVNGSHVDDVNAILGDPYFKGFRENVEEPIDYNQADRLVSDHVMKYYANFAYTGNPNEGPHVMPTPWPAYDLTGRGFLLETPWPVQQAIQGELQAEYEWFLNDYQDIRAGEYNTGGGSRLVVSWLLLVAVAARVIARTLIL